MHPSSLLPGVLVVATLVASLIPAPSARAQDKEKKKVRLTVLAILGTDRDTKVDKRLECIAQKVQKLRPTLTGFQLKRASCYSVEEGTEYRIPLVDREFVLVTVEHGADKNNRVGLTVIPPQMGTISYDCCCGKFLPIWTDYKTKNKECLFVAIMVSPCNDGCDQETDE